MNACAMEPTTDAPLVDPAWLAARLGEPRLRIFDCTVHLRPAVPGPYRVESGRADYDRAHIPGAAFLDLQRDLSDPRSPLRFTLPASAPLAAAFGAAGISAQDWVVLYSSTLPMWATRVWWMLRSAGHPRALVLDGGLSGWQAAGHPVVTEPTCHAPARFDGTPRPGLWADRHEVRQAIGVAGTCTVNALSRALHTGESELNYGRKGHIRGSVNVSYAALLQDDGRFREPAALRDAFATVGATPDRRVIVYCGGGIAATMNALALVITGHADVAVYDGSMSEWVLDADLPMSVGADG